MTWRGWLVLGLLTVGPAVAMAALIRSALRARRREYVSEELRRRLGPRSDEEGT